MENEFSQNRCKNIIDLMKFYTRETKIDLTGFLKHRL